MRGWRCVGLGICKVGGVGSGSHHAPWILWAAARRSDISHAIVMRISSVKPVP